MGKLFVCYVCIYMWMWCVNACFEELNCECIGTLRIILYDLERWDLWFWCDCMCDWPWGPWSEEISRPGGLEDIYILRMRLRLRLWLRLSLGREGGDVTSPSRYVGVGRPIVLCVEVWLLIMCVWRCMPHLFVLFYHIIRNVIGGVREAFQWVDMDMPCEMWNFMLNVIYVVWCAVMDYDFVIGRVLRFWDEGALRF